MDDSIGKVWVVDGSAPSGRSLAALARSLGLRCEVFASADDGLAALAAAGDATCPECILFDSGTCATTVEAFQARLQSEGILAPLVVTTDPADVAGAVAAMRRGAFTVVGRPCSVDQIESAIRDAITFDAQSRAERRKWFELARRFDALDDRQRCALGMIVGGLPNKLIARKLGVSKRTVDRIRAEIFAVLGVESAVEAVRLAVLGGWINQLASPADWPEAASTASTGATERAKPATATQPPAETTLLLHAPQRRRPPHFRRARADRSPALGTARNGGSESG